MGRATRTLIAAIVCRPHRAAASRDVKAADPVLEPHLERGQLTASRPAMEVPVTVPTKAVR
jgi:hypothetical protein